MPVGLYDLRQQVVSLAFWTDVALPTATCASMIKLCRQMPCNRHCCHGEQCLDSTGLLGLPWGGCGS